MQGIKKGFFKEDIVSYEGFIPKEDCEKLIKYFKTKTEWNPVAFYESYGMNMITHDPALEEFGLPADYLGGVAKRMQEAVEDAHGRPVKVVSTHAQKWETGSFASYHSDNSDMEGKPSAWEPSRFVCLVYLNDDYVGGELDFRDHNITIAPPVGILITFPGGIDNVHAVKEVTEGCRYTLGAFWDYAESEYTEERKAEWEEEIRLVREQQEKMYAEWAEAKAQ
jgi:hypothetical protein